MIEGKPVERNEIDRDEFFRVLNAWRAFKDNNEGFNDPSNIKITERRQLVYLLNILITSKDGTAFWGSIYTEDYAYAKPDAYDVDQRLGQALYLNKYSTDIND